MTSGWSKVRDDPKDVDGSLRLSEVGSKTTRSVKGRFGVAGVTDPTSWSLLRRPSVKIEAKVPSGTHFRPSVSNLLSSPY